MMRGPKGVNAQYNVARAGSLPVRIAGRQRKKMFEIFVSSVDISDTDTILDVGVTGDESYGHSNYFEAMFARPQQITAVGMDDARFLETAYPGLKFVRADGRQLPFADRSFDYVHSSAVVEHVGSRSEQQQFLCELWRVARKGVFVTTPNRWFPIEFHTVLPMIHWLPARVHRRIFRAIGYAFFAEEANLNLVSRSDLGQLARSAGFHRFRIEGLPLLGWPANLLLLGSKDETVA
jgi:ubiquinone/menaquinone biosynthesis C-methylase UbiE